MTITAQKMKFSIKDFFSICDQIRRKLRIWSHLLKKFLKNLIFCAMNVLFAFGSYLQEVKQNLSQDLLKLSEWFCENWMILNPEKRHYMCLWKVYISDTIRHTTSFQRRYLKLFKRYKLKKKLNFENHIRSLYSKASQKLRALQRISNLLDTHKFFFIQFYNKTLVQLLPTCLDFCSRRSSSPLNNIHERALRIVYDDHNNSYPELQMTENEPTIYQQNGNVLMKEIF